MKFSPAVLAVLIAPLALPLCAQNPLPPPPSQDAPAAHGKVIFSRSSDENGQTQSTVAAPEIRQTKAPTAADSERSAVTFTDFDLDVRMRLSTQQMAVRAVVTVRNDGKTPLRQIPLQISSALNWEAIRVQGREVAFTVAKLNSDVDHTGQISEAAVPLAAPLAPGASLKIDAAYSGAVIQTAQRLLAIGTPAQVALHADWDRISPEFTGLRGFGNVLWYPCASLPVILGDGARLFDEMGEHKQRIAGAHFRLQLTVEYPHGQTPNVALINGHPVALAYSNVDSVGPLIDGVATARLADSTLGFETPSLFLAARTRSEGSNTTFWTLPTNEPNVADWAQAATRVTPFLQGWLGQRPRAELNVLDLPDAEDAPFETGALLATSVRLAEPDQLDGIFAHALTHAWMQSPRAWLSEGVAHFMGTLWLERSKGRQRALESLEASRNALAMVEPTSPGAGPGEPLTQAYLPIYYRTKATYVLWMLRSVAGDDALSAALRAYNPAEDVSLGYGHDTAPSPFQKLLEQAGERRDLSWFFNDWVNSDKGLPDLSIEGAFPSVARAGNWLVSVNLSNAGYAAVEIPVTVRSEKTSLTQRVRVPARGKAVQRMLIQGKPTEVQANDGTVPETTSSLHVTSIVDALNATPAPPAELPRR